MVLLCASCKASHPLTGGPDAAALHLAIASPAALTPSSPSYAPSLATLALPPALTSNACFPPLYLQLLATADLTLSFQGFLHPLRSTLWCEFSSLPPGFQCYTRKAICGQ